MEINFIMTDEDERSFVDYIHENACAVIKYVLLQGEEPEKFYECKNELSLYYCILDNTYNMDDVYKESDFDGNLVKEACIADDNFHMKPIIMFTRGRFNMGIGRLYVGTTLTMTNKEKMFVKNKYKIFRQWIVKNANHVVKVDAFHSVYLLPGAAKEFLENGAVLPL